MFSLFWRPSPPPPPSLPSKNLAMHKDRNSLLECVQLFQAYRLGSYPTDNIISVVIIIFNKKNIIFVLKNITRLLKLTKDHIRISDTNHCHIDRRV